MYLVVNEGGTQLACEGERLRVVREGRTVQEVRLQSLDGVLALGTLGITAQAARRRLRRGIDVTFLDQRGRYLGRLSGPGSRNAALRLEQVRRALDEPFRLALAARFVRGKLRNQRAVLLRYRRRHDREAIRDAAGRLRVLAERTGAAEDLEELMGIEGAGSRVYFSVFGRLLKNPLFTFPGRNRRPPRDPVNACLSFGYTVTGALLEGEVAGAGLDPAQGYLHRPAWNRPSLALDLLEEMRAPVVDSLVLTLINRNQLGPADFGPPGENAGGEGEDTSPWLDEAPEPNPAREGAVHLGRTGRPVFLKALLGRLRETAFHPATGQRLEIREIFRRQVWNLARAITEGDPTLYEPWHLEE